MREQRIREIVREEIRRTMKANGISIQEDTPKVGNRVSTPHGNGRVLTWLGASLRVRLDSGNIMNINRSKVVTL